MTHCIYIYDPMIRSRIVRSRLLSKVKVPCSTRSPLLYITRYSLHAEYYKGNSASIIIT